MRYDIAVVGSINTDVSVVVARLPRPGETVSGGDLRRDGGGKGANQAVAAARLGRRVALVGAVGADDAGRARKKALEKEGIDVTAVAELDLPTGTALITVDSTGANTIVVAPGANRMASLEAIGAVCAVSQVVLVQYEIPDGAIGIAVEAPGTVIVNPAPFRDIPGIVAAADVVVPNETELSDLTGVEAEAPLDALAAAAASLGVPAVVVTLGGRGALVVEGPMWTHVPAPRVEAVDTTAAGDAFCAGLADAMVGGADVLTAARWAVRVGSAATLRRGAQASLPTRSEVAAL